MAGVRVQKFGTQKEQQLKNAAGNVTGAAIISEIGDISKFDSPKKLVAYAGLDASVSQSGEFEATHNVMSKPWFTIFTQGIVLLMAVHPL